LAQEAVNAQAANILLMGALTAMPALPLQAEDYVEALTQRFKGAVYEMNQKVLRPGVQFDRSLKAGSGIEISIPEMFCRHIRTNIL
jgi:Pyruvate/2-oxoacid:ferredoxin oxidoreductase gamma subunit